MVPPKTSARKVCMDVCETKAQSAEPVPSASAIRDTDTRKTWRADGPAGRRPPDAVAVWLGWRAGATARHRTKLLHGCLSACLAFILTKLKAIFLFFSSPLGPKKGKSFNVFMNHLILWHIKCASLSKSRSTARCFLCQNMFLTLNTIQDDAIFCFARKVKVLDAIWMCALSH